MTRIPIAVQLYSVRHDAEKDLAGTLDAIAQMGYEGVEFAGYYGHGADELKQMLDSRGLKCAGTHTSLDSLRGEQLHQTIAMHKTLDNKFLIIPGLPGEYYQSREKWLEFCSEISQIAEHAGQHDMIVGYHNHSAEFKEFEGETLMETFLKNTPQSVVAQFDIGNAMDGGGDCLPLLEKYPGRAGTIHLKEHKAGDPAAFVGDGDVQWPRVFDLCESQGATQWYIVEYESDALTPIECIDRCLQNLKKMGK